MSDIDLTPMRDAPARSRPAARKENLPVDFVHRTVDAATAPRPQGCLPSSPFLLACPVAADDAIEPEAPQLRVEFYVGGVARLVMGGGETFLSPSEARALGSMLVANAPQEGS